MAMEGYTETNTVLYKWKISANKIQHCGKFALSQITIVSTNMSSNGIETITFVLNGCRTV